MSHRVCVYLGEALAGDNFGATHPSGPQRHLAFTEEVYRQGWIQPWTSWRRCWSQVETLIRAARAQCSVFQCGAGSMTGDPIAQLCHSRKDQAHAATRLFQLADERCEGRLVAIGGGAYLICRIWSLPGVLSSGV